MKVIGIITLAWLPLLGISLHVTPALSDEFGDNTPYYEDDGLLDITEWFDGNDYNPTDEAWWRWDDETYQASKDVSGDFDNDWYGYTTTGDDDWYYDYYDPYPYGYLDVGADEVSEYSYHYHDYNNDGIYDAYTAYTDRDADGIYEDIDYYWFGTTGATRQPQVKQSTARESRLQTASGKVTNVKTVQVRGGRQNLVVEIRPQDDQTKPALIADLGNVEALKDVKPAAGDMITVRGPKAVVGDKTVVLANSLESKGQTVQIQRDRRNMSGKVLSIHKTNVRGKEHLLAMVQTTRDGKISNVAVDLGPAANLNPDLQGKDVVFSGFPVKVKDRVLVLAETLGQDGRTVFIDRRTADVATAKSASGEKR